MNQIQEYKYYLPGGSLLKRTIPLTDEERQQYIDFFASKGVRITPEQVQLVDGIVNIQWRNDHDK